jgi:Zn-dependent protease with chaperone function
MTDAEFVALTTRLQARHARWPRLYRAQVTALILLGYAYIAVVVIAIVGLSAWLILSMHANALTLKLAIPAVVLLGLTVEALWVRVTPPEGPRIRPEEAPDLFRVLEELRVSLRAPRIDEVTANLTELNASVQQIARFGVLGWHRNYLVLGLPLMLAMDEEQLRAVLAHEYAHVSYQHGRRSIWIHRSSAGWEQLIIKLREERHRAAFIFEAFFKWYSPVLAAYYFALARQLEYDADTLAARIVGAAAVGQMLVVLHLRSLLQSSGWWETMVARHKEEPDPPESIVEASLAPFLRGGIRAEAPGVRLLLDAEPAPKDSHPSLAQRLRSLGQLEPFEKMAAAGGFELPPLAKTAADAYLSPPLRERLLRLADKKMFADISPGWRDAHRKVRQKVARLEALASASTHRPLSLAETWERASLTEDVKDVAAAEPFLREVLAMMPEHAAANQRLGAYLLAQKKDEGIAHIERAMRADPDYAGPGAALIVSYLAESDRHEQAAPYLVRIKTASEEADAAAQERNGVNATDPMAPHSLSHETVAALREEFRRERDIRRAYVVDKVVRHHPETPYRVLFVEGEEAWYAPRKAAANQALLSFLRPRVRDTGIDYYLIFAAKPVVFPTSSSRLQRAVANVKGSLIYDRDKPGGVPAPL